MAVRGSCFPTLVKASGSGWTKVAAFATRHLDGLFETGYTPQVIWDSRVANAVRKLVDHAEPQMSFEATGWLRETLRQVRGRGGERINLQLFQGWEWANTPKQKWEAQAAASRVIRHMRDTLNRTPAEFGLMPLGGGKTGPWTSWGVGLALFVEGY
jgi:hypothetical protein